MGEVGEAYAGTRQRIGALVAGLDGEGEATVVPTCPDWTVHDVVAHVAGVVDDALNGRLDGVATDPWTAAQVEARRGVPVAAIVEEWHTNAPAFEGLLDAIGDPGRQAVLDVLTHEHDLRLALGALGGRDADGVRVGFDFLGRMFVAAAGATGHDVRVTTTEGDDYGAAGAPVVLHGSRFELMRAMTGRRSEDQLRALAWTGEPVLDVFTFGPFRPAAAPVEE